MPSVDVGLTITAINNATASITQVGSDVKNLGDNAQATSNRLKAIQVVIAGILIEKTLEWGKALVTTASASQNLEIRMASFAGGAQQAGKIWDDLASSFAAAPFKMDGIASAWTRLRTVVNSNDQTTNIIKAIVNDVAAMGGSDENIDNLASSFTRLFASGTASAREYRSILQQTGLTIGDLATAAGVSSTQMARNLQHGFESAQALTDAFITASNARFGFFASNLKNSVGGAYNLVFNTIAKGMTDIGARTDINERMTVFFQNLATAIGKVMASISQKDIDHFFDWLQKMEPAAINAGKALVNIGIAVLDIGTAVVALLGKMTPEEMEFGMIGYYLFGAKGAVLLAMLAHVGSELPGAVGGAAASFQQLQQKSAATGTNTYQNILDYNNKQSPDQPINNMLTSSLEYAGGEFYSFLHGAGDAAKPIIDKGGLVWQSLFGGSSKGSNSMFGTQADLDKAKQALQNLISGFKGGSPIASGGSPQLADAMNAANNMTIQLNNTLKTTTDRVDELNYATNGDELGAAISKIKIEGDGYTKTIDAQISAESRLQIHTAANLAIVEALKQKRQDVVTAISNAITKEDVLFAIQKQEFLLQQQQAQLSSVQATQMLKINSSQDPMLNAFQGTSVGQNQLAVLQQQYQYLTQIASLRSQITQNEIQEQAVLADPQKVAALQQTNSLLNDQLTATQSALQSLSAVGRLTQQLWQNLGQTMENDVASGIAGVLTQTETLGDALRSIFKDMITMAVKFLEQLIEQQIFSTTAQTMSLATAGPTAAAMAALWGPAAMAASIATFGGADAAGALAYEGAMASSLIPFAMGGVPGLSDLSGRILSGPTPFGLGGEAGEEGVLPLKRVNGRLGVSTDGGSGGNHYHVHVNAIDTQSGMQFIAQNIEQIDMRLKHQQRLNRGAK